MNTSYVVVSPIHGYANLGYSHLRSVRKEFATEKEAREHLRRCDEAFAMSNDPDADEDEDEFYREMTDNISFHFTGKSELFKKITTEEKIT